MDVLQGDLSSSCGEDQLHCVVDKTRHVHYHSQGALGVTAPPRTIADLARI